MAEGTKPMTRKGTTIREPDSLNAPPPIQWQQGDIITVRPVKSGDQRIAIRAKAHTTELWKRLGSIEGADEARNAAGEPGTDEIVTVERRIGVALALSALMNEEDREFWTGTRNAQQQRNTPVAAPIAWCIDRRITWIGPWALDRPVEAGAAMLPDKAAHAVVKRGGWSWHHAAGIWTARERRNACVVAAFATQTLLDKLTARGLPGQLAPWLRHAPALVPWNDEWTLLGTKGMNAPAGGHWQKRGPNAWATHDTGAAAQLRRFAPRPLADALAHAEHEGTKSTLNASNARVQVKAQIETQEQKV